MRTRTPLGITALLAILAIGGAEGQITSNPLPEPIVKRGLAVEIKDLVRLPDTRGLRPADQDVAPAAWARVSYVRDLPDGRRFANDSRGFLYLIDANNQPHVYADVAAAFPYGVYNRLESGFIGFAFHPEFATNGLFYTISQREGAGESEDSGLHSDRVRLEGRDLPQRHHRVARDQPGGQYIRGHAARTPARGPRGHQPHASDGRGGIQPDGETRRSRITACSTPAAAIMGSATAADRTRAIPPRRSGSIRS